MFIEIDDNQYRKIVESSIIYDYDCMKGRVLLTYLHKLN